MTVLYVDEQILVLVEQVTAFPDAFYVDALADIVPEGIDEFRLALVEFQDPVDGLGHVERLVQRRLGDASAQGFLSDAVQPDAEGFGLLRPGGSRQDAKKQETKRMQRTKVSEYHASRLSQPEGQPNTCREVQHSDARNTENPHDHAVVGV